MDVDRRTGPDAALGLGAPAVAWLTRTPAGGSGWEWGAPRTEQRCYGNGLGSEATVQQLVGNLLLLAPLAVLAVSRFPRLSTPPRPAALAVPAGTGLELRRWALPLRRGGLAALSPRYASTSRPPACRA